GNGTGWLPAIDMDSGKISWSKALPFPAQGGALITATGLVFTSDLGGSLYAYKTATGEQVWHTANLPTPKESRVLAYRLGVGAAGINGTDGQVARAAPQKGGGEPAETVGSAPYTPEQVAAGATAYAQRCALCHGAQLQGLAAPALAGPAFARTKPTLAQLHAVVTKNMPLTAPGTLPAADYAAIMA